MLKDATYLEQYELIKGFIPDIVRSIRRDLRQDHLKQDEEFLQKHFAGKNPNKLKVEDLSPVYESYLKEGSEKIWEFFTDRWLLKHENIYEFFEQRLMAVDENFSELDELDTEVAKQIAESSKKRFGALETYIFSVLNSVVFPKSVYSELRIAAEKEKQ